VNVAPSDEVVTSDATQQRSPDADLIRGSGDTPATAGRTVASSPQIVAAKLQEQEDERVAVLCRQFQADRHALDDDPSIEWVEGWHGIRDGNQQHAVPGILADEGLFVTKSVSYMPVAAYWHAKQPSRPQQWSNHGVEIHFRVPKLYLESQGKFVNDPSAGGRFSHESSTKAPRSKANPNQEIMPVQVLEVYWVKGKIPESCAGTGVDLTNTDQWPETPADE